MLGTPKNLGLGFARSLGDKIHISKKENVNLPRDYLLGLLGICH
jgi:hypothetical protein